MHSTLRVAAATIAASRMPDDVNSALLAKVDGTVRADVASGMLHRAADHRRACGATVTALLRKGVSVASPERFYTATWR